MYSLIQLGVATCCLLSSSSGPFVQSLQLTPRPSGATAGASSISTASQSRLFRPAPRLPFLARKASSSRTSQNNIGRLAALFSSLTDQAEASPTSSSEEDDGPQLGAWIPIGSAAALASLSPISIKVMNLDLAVWYSEETKKWSVLSDACPHRLAPLSQGRIDPATGRIECAYHGWQFDTDGQVQDIPQRSGTEQDLQRVASEPKSKYNAQNFPVHVSGDMIFAFIPSAIHGESFPRSFMPEDMYPDLVDEVDEKKVYYVRDLPYSFDFLVENFMDPAHIPFAHHGLQGKRVDGSNIPMKILVNNFTMVEVAFADISANKTREGVVSFQRPSYYHYRTQKPDGEYKRNLMIYVVPIQEGKCRVLFSSPAPKWIPTWLSHAGSNRFLNTDVWLHDVERKVRSKGQHVDVNDLYVRASSSDLGVNAFRKWWNKNGYAKAPPHTFGPASMEQLGPNAMTRAEMIDPWVNHVKHCSACRNGLIRWKQIQKASLALSFLAAALLGRRKPLVAAILSLMGLGLHNFSNKVATIMEGNPHQSGITDRSAASMKD